MSETLKQCPFCGGDMTISRMGDGVTAWWQIGRSAVSPCRCRLFMESDLFNEFDTEASERERERLVERWNTRHERTCRVESSEYDECCECFITKLSCGCTVIDGWGFGGRYCPNCGAKVVD